MPVIAARQPLRWFMPCWTTATRRRRENERVQVDLKAVRDGVVVDLRRQPAGADQGFAIQAVTIGHRAQLIRSVARMPAASAANIDAQLVRAVQSALQSAPARTW